MSTVAEQLRLGREAKKLTIHQVADATNIRTDHIRALEEGNFDVFSAPVYIRGFTRTYVKLLGLDMEKIMAELNVELSGTEKFREPPPLTDQKRGIMYFITLQLSKVNWRIASVVIGLGLVVAMIGGSIMLWRHQQKSDPLAHLTPGVYQSTSTGETLPLPNVTPKR